MLQKSRLYRALINTIFSRQKHGPQQYIHGTQNPKEVPGGKKVSTVLRPGPSAGLLFFGCLFGRSNQQGLFRISADADKG
jgi:hypothetical protein